MAHIETVEIPTTHGMLEGLLRTSEDASPPRRIALVCHPHPLGGGTMHNKVVFAITRALSDLGIPALRFNFRGVGRSTGSYDNGRGESDDVRSALDWLANRYPDLPIISAGFSFGVWVGLPIGATDPRVTHLIGVGVPVSHLSVAPLDECPKPKLFVQGTRDEYGALPDLEGWFAKVAEPKTLQIIEGATHFFVDQLPELATAITAWTQKQEQ